MATLGFASFPAFIALIDWLVFRERIGRAEITLLAMITAGLVLVTPAFDAADQNTVGLLWGVLSGFTFALLAVINRRASRGMDAIQVSLWQNLIVLLVVAPFVSGSSIAQATPGDWLGISLLGILCTGVAHYLFVRSLEGLDARSVGMIVSLEPVYAIACAWWLFDEQPSLRMLAGAALIILASVQVSRAKKAGH
ncbi:MAG: DMT family transporter, partial [Lautropia sp.]|nr:DMT family transporter [Lautropia sp.]